jgi:hypothetical protein
MNRGEKALVVAALLNIVLYVPYFFLQVYRLESRLQVSPSAIFPWQFFGMGLNFVVLVATIRDLYEPTKHRRGTFDTFIESVPAARLRLSFGSIDCATVTSLVQPRPFGRDR